MTVPLRIFACAPQDILTSIRKMYIAQPFIHIHTHLSYWGCHENLYYRNISTYLSSWGCSKIVIPHKKNTFLTEWTWPHLNENPPSAHLWFIQQRMCFSCGIMISEHPQQREICWCLCLIKISVAPSNPHSRILTLTPRPHPHPHPSEWIIVNYDRFFDKNVIWI